MASTSTDGAYLKDQLSIARSEIQNLRKQIQALTYAHQTDLKNIKDILNDFQCANCKQHQQPGPIANIPVATPTVKDKLNVSFKAIGVIRTDFPEKRAVPRQPTIGPKLQGCIALSRDIFTNPEHSLDGLHEFSHLWIIYHFHRNDSHAKAKVAPPRLGGERVGIFSTRSPHRPCPIGLSLVEIDRIDGSEIYFNGTDMVDGTPVLDIKPYIPRYDNPLQGNDFAECISTFQADENYGSREEPDGQETDLTNGAYGGSGNSQSSHTLTHATAVARGMSISNSRNSLHSAGIKVPNWVLSDSTLNVVFNERAEQQVLELQINKANVVDVLQTDPRSVYLRTRYGSQIFTFQLGEVTVTCKFDDGNSLVTVLQVRLSENLTNEPKTN